MSNVLTVKIGEVEFANPVWVASGTFGNGEEFSDFLDLNKVGAIITKTVTLEQRTGNRVPRIIETASGLLNSIGLENKGMDRFKKDCMPFLRKLKTKIVISIAGSTPEEFEQCVDMLQGDDAPDAIEINLSCPNVSHKGARYTLFAQDPAITEKITASVKKRTKAAVITKLTPGVTDIGIIARAAENGGADAVAMVNTYPAMAIDAHAMKPVLGNITGGLSGPAIKPLALKAVWDAFREVTIPIVGIGGIMNGLDAAEFILAGATAVELGTANLVDPTSYTRVLEEYAQYLREHKVANTNDLIGKIRTE